MCVVKTQESAMLLNKQVNSTGWCSVRVLQTECSCSSLAQSLQVTFTDWERKAATGITTGAATSPNRHVSVKCFGGNYSNWFHIYRRSMWSSVAVGLVLYGYKKNLHSSTSKVSYHLNWSKRQSVESTYRGFAVGHVLPGMLLSPQGGLINMLKMTSLHLTLCKEVEIVYFLKMFWDVPFRVGSITRKAVVVCTQCASHPKRMSKNTLHYIFKKK